MSKRRWLITSSFSPIPNVTMKIADNQSSESYCDIRKAISKIAGIESIVELITSESIDQHSIDVHKKKRNIVILWGAGWILITVSALLFVKNLAVEYKYGPAIYLPPLIIGGLIILKTEFIRNMPIGFLPSNLKDKRIKDALTLLISHEPKLYCRDIEGNFYSYSPNLWHADNSIAYLLAEPCDRPPIFLEGKFQPGPIFIEEKIVEELVKTLKPSPLDTDVEHGNEEIIKQSSLLEVTLTPEDTLKKKTSYIGKIELIITLQYLDTLELLLLISDELKSIDQLPKEIKLTKPRRKWIKIFNAIAENWRAWQHLQGREIAGNEDRQQLIKSGKSLERSIKSIINPDNLLAKSTTEYYDQILTGKYRPLIDWLCAVETYTKTHRDFRYRLDFTDHKLSDLPTTITQQTFDFSDSE